MPYSVKKVTFIAEKKAKYYTGEETDLTNYDSPENKNLIITS